VADATTDVSKLNGWFKEKHGKFVDPLLEISKLYDMLGDIQKAQKIGRHFAFPIELSLPQGVTYAAAGAGAFAFEDTVPGEMKEALIDASQIAVSDIMDFETAAKAVAEGEEAYGDAGERLVKRIKKAGKKRLELSTWYGQHYIAKISAISGTSTARVLTIDTSEWSSGMWCGMKNMKLDAWDVAAFTTKQNTNAAIIITSVQIAARTLTVSGNASDLTALDTPAAAGTAVLTPYNSRTSSSVVKEMAGINKITTNSGSLFGIDASSYELWQGNTFDNLSVAFSLKKLQDSICDAVGKGLDEKAIVFVNPRTWANLCSDQAALRKYDASFSSSKATNGFRALSMYSQNGELDIMPHPIIKEGESWVVPVERMMKIGAQELGFNVPGRGGEYFDNATNSSGQALAGFRLMAYANAAVICGAPGLLTKITNIVNA
jgi:hypothetical protein